MKTDGKKRMIAAGCGLAAVIGIIIVVSIIVTGKDTYVRSKKDNGLSRYEWLAMVCEQFGVDESETDEPYCKDVESDNDYFIYVQSAVEWKLVERNSSFQGEKPVSGRFAVKTAMKAIGEKALQVYLGRTEEMQDADYIELALDKGIIEKEQLTENLTKAECEALLGRISQFYLVELFEEDVINVAYKENVIELPEQSVVEENENSIKVTAEQIADLKAGDVIVFNSILKNTTLAKRISSIEQPDTILLEDVELEQVIENLSVLESLSVTFDDIAKYYGLREENGISRHDIPDATVIPLAKTKENAFTDKGFKINLTTDNDEISMSITDNNTGLEYSFGEKPEDEDILPSGCSIATELDVQSINVKTVVKHSGLFVDYIQLIVDIDSEISYALQGELEKSIPLFSVPLSGSIVSVIVDFNLLIGANGEVKIVAEIPLQQGVVYEDGVGVRKLQSNVEYETPTLEINCEGDFAVQAEPVVMLLGMDVIDTELNVGVSASVGLADHVEMQCLDIAVAFPTVSLEVFGDDEKDSILKEIVDALDCTLNWEIISSDNAPIHMGFHYEIYADADSAYVENCTYQQVADSNTANGENDQAEEREKEDIQSVGTTNTYTTRLGKVNAVPAPTFQFDYPDNWTIIKEEVMGEDFAEPDETNGYMDEIVKISNERGVEITYISQATPDISYYAPRIMYDVNIEKEADSSFVPSYVDAEDFSYMGDFVVAKIQTVGFLWMDTDSDFTETDGPVYYAVLPESDMGDNVAVQASPASFEFRALYFYYPTAYAFFAESPDDTFTEEEIKEVIAILSSFRAGYDEGNYEE